MIDSRCGLRPHHRVADINIEQTPLVITPQGPRAHEPFLHDVDWQVTTPARKHSSSRKRTSRLDGGEEPIPVTPLMAASIARERASRAFLWISFCFSNVAEPCWLAAELVFGSDQVGVALSEGIVLYDMALVMAWCDEDPVFFGDGIVGDGEVA